MYNFWRTLILVYISVEEIEIKLIFFSKITIGKSFIYNVLSDKVSNHLILLACQFIRQPILIRRDNFSDKIIEN